MRVNKTHKQALVAGTIFAAILVVLTRDSIGAVLLTAGTIAPFGLLPAWQWLLILILVMIAWGLSYDRFGLLSCVAVNYVLLTAYLLPLSRPMGWGGSMIALYVFTSLVTGLVASFSGTIGFVIGTTTRSVQ